MRFSQFVLFVLINLCLAGCQKEYSLETDTAPPAAGSGLLEKAVLKDAVSELTYLYDYNASGLPSRNLFSLTATGFSADGTIKATRDASGKISRSQIELSSSQTTKPDTITYELKRNTSGKVIYSLALLADTTNTIGYDSMVYTYNAAGKIAGYINYIVEYGTGLAAPIQRFEMTWSGNNVVKMVEYELAGSLSSAKLVETITFFYDTKPAARVFSEDEFIAALAPANNMVPAENNTIKYSREYTETPEDNEITEYNYTYGANGKPVSAAVTTTRPGLPATKALLTFTYR